MKSLSPGIFEDELANVLEIVTKGKEDSESLRWWFNTSIV